MTVKDMKAMQYREVIDLLGPKVALVVQLRQLLLQVHVLALHVLLLHSGNQQKSNLTTIFW